MDERGVCSYWKDKRKGGTFSTKQKATKMYPTGNQWCVSAYSVIQANLNSQNPSRIRPWIHLYGSPWWFFVSWIPLAYLSGSCVPVSGERGVNRQLHKMLSYQGGQLLHPACTNTSHSVPLTYVYSDKESLALNLNHWDTSICWMSLNCNGIDSVSHVHQMIHSNYCKNKWLAK